MLQPTIDLFVFVVLESGRTIRAGRLLVENLHMAHRGGYQGVFRYDPGYLTAPERYPLDPVNLPLLPESLMARRPEVGLHGVFEDSLPGKWGNTILAYKAGFHGQHYAKPHLLAALGKTGLGALIYSTEFEPPEAAEDSSIDFQNLADALDEAAIYEGNRLQPPEFKFLVSGGYSAGGARPKVLVKKSGDLFIAKFSSIHDRSNSIAVELEAAGLELGQRAGLVVPDFHVEYIRLRPVLLVKRFDTTPQGGRKALISFSTLLGQEPTLGTYSGMADKIRRYSVQPRSDLAHLFKQMVLNVAIHNTDDHLQNFSMIHDSQGWRLSPAYDLTSSFLQSVQATKIDGQDTELGVEQLVNEGKRFGYTRKKSMDLLGEVGEALNGWQDLITSGFARERINMKMKAIFPGLT